jgi:hypothetical protein
MSQSRQTAAGRQLNHPSKYHGIDEIRVSATGSYTVFLDTGDTVTVSENGEACDCGNCEPVTIVQDPSLADDVDGPVVTPNMGPAETHALRRNARCAHANAVLDALDIGTCPVCGSHTHRVVEHTNGWGHIDEVSTVCDPCGYELD